MAADSIRSITASSDLNARAECGDVHFLAFGDFVELQQSRRRRGSGIITRVMISSGATTVCFWPCVEVFDGHAARLPRMLTSSSSAEVIIRKQKWSRQPAIRAAMLPTSVATLRICGEPNRSVSAWISGNESWARSPRAAPRSRCRPLERTPPSMVIGAQLANAREAQDRRRFSSPCVFRSNPSLGVASR